VKKAAPMTKSFDWKVGHLVTRESLQITEYAAADCISHKHAAGLDLSERVSGFASQTERQEEGENVTMQEQAKVIYKPVGLGEELWNAGDFVA
jgi:hypothetical protein